MMNCVAQFLQECSHVEEGSDVGVVVGGSLSSSALLLLLKVLKVEVRVIVNMGGIITDKSDILHVKELEVATVPLAFGSVGTVDRNVGPEQVLQSGGVSGLLDVPGGGGVVAAVDDAVGRTLRVNIE